MKIDLFDPEEFIKLNKLKEVTSPVLFQRGNVPHPDGLVSNEIFGVTIKKRKRTFAYIDLHGYYFTPHIYKALKRLFRNIEKIVSGEEYYSIDSNGKLVKDPNGETGIDFLHDNWGKIKWEYSKDPGMRNERIDLFTKTPINEIFIKSEIVIPAYYRDITSYQKGGGETSDLNRYYSSLIRLCSLAKEKAIFDFSFHSTNASIQNLLVSIYDYFKEKLESKTGLLRKYLMGKNVDYCTRTVITSPTYHANSPDDLMIDFNHCGVPISQVCSLCYPFVVEWLRNFFEREFIQNKYSKIVYNPISDTVEEILELNNPDSYFNDKYIKKMIDTYVKDPESRFNPIQIPVTGNKVFYAAFTGKRLNPGTKAELSNISNRRMTWTDLLYMAAEDIVKDKHVMVTRYPVSDAFGLFLARIRVLSTTETEPMEVNGKIYRWYPKVDLNANREKILVSFIDSVQFSNSYLPGLGGDYDGDQTTIKIFWTIEANEECEKIINQKSYYLNISGENIRKLGNESSQTLFSLTKNPSNKSRVITATEKSELLKLSPTDLTYDKLISMFADLKEPGSFKIKPAKFLPTDKMTLKPTDYFQKGEVETTVGRFIYNKILVEGMGFQKINGYVNEEITDGKNGKIESAISDYLLRDEITVSQMNRYIDTRDWFTLQLHSAITSSFTPKTIKIPPKVEALKKQLIKENIKALEAGDEKVSEMIEKKLIEAIKEEYKDDVGLDIYISGARGSVKNNLKNIVLMKGAVKNDITGKYDIVTNSLMDGLRKEDIPSSANSILSGAYPKAVGTQVSGYMAKKLLAAMQTEVLDVRGSDCGTKRTLDITLSERNSKDFKYRFIEENGRLVCLNPQEMKKRIGKTVKMRSPMMCTGDKLCNHCAGDLYYMLGIENIGLSASRVATTLTNLNMKKFHENLIVSKQINTDDIYF